MRNNLNLKAGTVALAIADAFKARAKAGDDNVVSGAVEAIAENYPEGITEESLARHNSFIIDAADGLSLGLAEFGTEHMKGNKDVSKLSLSARLGGVEFNSTFERERSGVTAGKPWQKFGVLTTDVVTGAGLKRGNFAKIQSYANEEAKSVFQS